MERCITFLDLQNAVSKKETISIPKEFREDYQNYLFSHGYIRVTEKDSRIYYEYKGVLIEMPSMEEVQKKAEEDDLNILIAFYALLGWDRETELDPTKIKIDKVNWNWLLELLREQLQDNMSANMLYLNVGPSSSEAVPKGKVLIEDGAF